MASQRRAPTKRPPRPAAKKPPPPPGKSEGANGAGVTDKTAGTTDTVMGAGTAEGTTVGLTADTVTASSITEDPATTEPVTDGPATASSITEGPATTEPVTDGPATADSVTEGPGTTDSLAEGTDAVAKGTDDDAGTTAAPSALAPDSPAAAKPAAAKPGAPKPGTSPTPTKGRPTPTKSGGKGATKSGGSTIGRSGGTGTARSGNTAARSGNTAARSGNTGTARSGGAGTKADGSTTAKASGTTTAKNRPSGAAPKAGGPSGPNYRPPTGAARSASRRPPPRKKKRFTKKTLGAIIGVGLICTLVVFFAFAVNGASKSSGTASTTTGPEGVPIPSGPTLAAVNTSQYPQAVDGISCNTSEQLVYHIHIHLTIFVNGSARQIPYGIGITPPLELNTTDGPFVDGGTCFYWLHTHAADGIIHVESPTQKTYTLGQFFDEWGQPLNSGQVGPAVGKLTIYQDGKPYTGDPRNIQLTAHNQIQLDVGSPAPTQTLITFPTGL